MITLYDIPSTLPNKCWSLNTWKVRLLLNYKGISYKTEWLEYPEIEPYCRKVGIPSTGSKPDGSEWYTLPAIHDASSGIFVADSLLIAQYLDKTYPDTPKAIPHNTDAFQFAFADLHYQKHLPFWGFYVHCVHKHLHPESHEFFVRTREQIFGIQWDEIKPKGEQSSAQWNAYKDGLAVIDSYIAKTDAEGPYVMGNIISFADFIVASQFISCRMVWGENSEEWNEVKSLNDGRWGTYVQIFEKYQDR